MTFDGDARSFGGTTYLFVRVLLRRDVRAARRMKHINRTRVFEIFIRAKVRCRASLHRRIEIIGRIFTFEQTAGTRTGPKRTRFFGADFKRAAVAY